MNAPQRDAPTGVRLELDDGTVLDCEPRLIGVDGDGIAIALIDRRKLEHDDDSHMTVPTMRIRRIEIMSNKNDSGELVRLMLREFERRTGQTTLPLDLEKDLRAVVDAGVAAEEPADDEDSGGQDGMFGGEPDDSGGGGGS